MVSPTTENRKWPGFDHAGVHRADRDLVHPGALDGAERVRAVDVAERRRVAGVAAHRVPAAGPVEVADQPAGQRVIVRDDAEQVAHLAFEPAGGERQPGQAGHMRVGRVAAQRAARRGGPAPAAVNRYTTRSAGPAPSVVVAGDQRDPEPVRPAAPRRGRRELVGGDGARDAVVPDRLAGGGGGRRSPVTMAVACAAAGQRSMVFPSGRRRPACSRSVQRARALTPMHRGTP